MKKQIISLSVTLIITLAIISCGSKSSTSQTTSSNPEQMAADTVDASKPVAAVYQCPMKCEGEKTYDQAGKCPKCGMDLEGLSGHEGHEH